MSSSPDDASYLLTDVYRVHDATGFLSSSARGRVPLVDPRAAPPAYARALLDANAALAGAASRGDLVALHETLLELRGDELQPPALAEAIRAAAVGGHVLVVEYLLRRGLAPDREALIFAVANAAIDAAIDADAARAEAARDEGAAAAASPSPADAIAAAEASIDRECAALVTAVVPFREGGDADAARADGAAALDSASADAAPDATVGTSFSPAAMLAYMCLRVGADASGARAVDHYSPLHITALHGLVRETAALVFLGADASAIARDDTTPLGALARGRADFAHDDYTHARYDACERVLRAAGGCADLAAVLARPRAQSAAAACASAESRAWAKALRAWGGRLAQEGEDERSLPAPIARAAAPQIVEEDAAGGTATTAAPQRAHASGDSLKSS